MVSPSDSLLLQQLSHGISNALSALGHLLVSIDVDTSSAGSSSASLPSPASSSSRLLEDVPSRSLPTPSPPPPQPPPPQSLPRPHPHDATQHALDHAADLPATPNLPPLKLPTTHHQLSVASPHPHHPPPSPHPPRSRTPHARAVRSAPVRPSSLRLACADPDLTSESDDSLPSDTSLSSWLSSVSLPAARPHTRRAPQSTSCVGRHASFSAASTRESHAHVSARHPASHTMDLSQLPSSALRDHRDENDTLPPRRRRSTSTLFSTHRSFRRRRTPATSTPQSVTPKPRSTRVNDHPRTAPDARPNVSKVISAADDLLRLHERYEREAIKQRRNQKPQQSPQSPSPSQHDSLRTSPSPRRLRNTHSQKHNPLHCLSPDSIQLDSSIASFVTDTDASNASFTSDPGTPKRVRFASGV